MYSGDLVLRGFGESRGELGEKKEFTQRAQRQTTEFTEKTCFLLSGRWYLLASHGGGKFCLGDKVEIVKAPASEGGRYKGERGGPPEGGRYTE